MKNKFLMFFMLLGPFWISGCEDRELATLSESVTANTLSALDGSNFVLTKDDEAEDFQTFTWTAVDFGFPASVNYTLQVDRASNSFEAPFDLASTNELSVTVKVSEMNEALLALGFTPQEAVSVAFRVVASIGSDVPPIVSSASNAELTPYATAFPPIYGMGAGLKGWGPWPDNAVEFQSEEFNKFQTITLLTNNGEAFRFFAQLDWNPVSYNYPFFTTVSPLFENAGDGDSNFKFVGATGYYSISVDLTAKTVTAEPTEEPALYMMGAAINGWGPWSDKEVKMTYIKPGVFETTTNFQVEAFRFFAQAAWEPISYNYPFFESVDSKFENAADGDSNLKFVGEPGAYKITVNLNEKTVVIGDQPVPKLFMMGGALNGWGPWNDKEVELTYVSPGVYTATATFISGEIFRFFGQADWNPTSYNYNYFTTVDPLFELNPGDGDNNLKYVGATGAVNIRVNLTTKVITVE
ncbi:hypothetical protein SanaruYs_33890 [Chryseotalea sanaruensis]|uniref:Uncharacterized protein n=1 Tax=Chryseotalea sanaruensis TaxID=2482724 RepID=A0A401UE14_9BACT|nr:SusE domain-containing protein [Chryseotalea sanaruensis]GCC53146.1 hypothetical protein SanaruYs_33890 [Chryseotalea sanaruensis]